MEKPAFHLEVSRQILIDGLRLLKRTVARRKHEEAVLSYDAESLLVEIGGGGFAVPATGIWEGQVRVRGPLILDLASRLQTGDHLEIRVDGATLSIGTLRLQCTVQDAWSKSVDLPLDIRRADVAAHLASNSREDLVASGLGALVPPGELESESFAIRLDAAAKLLAPERVSREELLQWLKSRDDLIQGDLFE